MGDPDGDFILLIRLFSFVSLTSCLSGMIGRLTDAIRPRFYLSFPWFRE